MTCKAAKSDVGEVDHNRFSNWLLEINYGKNSHLFFH